MNQAAVPTKIVLKSTTKITLNERFTNLEASRPKPSPAAQAITQKSAAVIRASQKEKRLAQQMANRPSVLAALNVKKRLGIQGRVGGGSVRGGRIQRGFSSIRGNASSFRGTRGVRGTFRGRSQTRGSFFRGRGASVIRARYGGNRGGNQGAMRGSGRGGGRGAPRGTGGRGRGSFRGRGGRGGRTAVSKESLDNQLDAYMAQN